MSKSSDSPASLLASFVSGKEQEPRLLILSGPSRAGKSTWCQKFADQARTAGVLVGGIISPPVFIGGQKEGIDIVCQLSGERRRLAERRMDRNEGFDTPNWRIDPGTLSWANRKLVEMPSCDCLILDELGPLELLHGKGLQAGLELVDSRKTSLTVVVIRPKLLPIAAERWPWGQVAMIAAGEMAERDSGELLVSLEDE